MAKNLVIVESPAKARTIERYLGRDFKVIASYGHVRDLPKSKLGIDVEHNFEPQYMVPRGSAKRIKGLRDAINKADTVYLATDPDREGEAIGWHLVAIAEADTDKFKRITFHEITKDAVRAALKDAHQLDKNLIDAQQARRVLDRLVGYSLSPVLWKKIRSGLSAGRVQSVALRLIVDREREIEAFKPEEYWSVEAEMQTAKPESFRTKLARIDGAKPELGTEKETSKIVERLNKSNPIVADYSQKPVKRRPVPPFITSTLQQEAGRKLNFTAKKTMTIAQQLYEGINLGGEHVGLITYMRTDSFNLSAQALSEAKTVIAKEYGDEHAAAAPRFYKKKVRGAQEAHEAIRPTGFARAPANIRDKLTPEQYKLYRLIWRRAIASQMPDALFLQTRVTVDADGLELRATGRQVTFEGFMKVYEESFDKAQDKSKDEEKEDQSQNIPKVSQGDKLALGEVIPEQHFTQPPPRYSEASLIKKLEEEGIGRPSTYAPTISTLFNRRYIKREKRQLVPEPVANNVTDLLNENFGFVTNEKFTAEMENKLDDIAEGKQQWQPVVEDFYKPMDKDIQEKTPNIKDMKLPDIPTDEKCEKCGKMMVIKSGRFGEFLACSGYPECKNTKSYTQPIGKCPDCEVGDVVEKRTRRSRTFWGCNRYPDCEYASWNKPNLDKVREEAKGSEKTEAKASSKKS